MTSLYKLTLYNTQPSTSTTTSRHVPPPHCPHSFITNSAPHTTHTALLELAWQQGCLAFCLFLLTIISHSFRKVVEYSWKKSKGLIILLFHIFNCPFSWMCWILCLVELTAENLTWDSFIKRVEAFTLNNKRVSRVRVIAGTNNCFSLFLFLRLIQHTSKDSRKTNEKVLFFVQDMHSMFHYYV